MKGRWMWLAGVGLIIASGAIAPQGALAKRGGSSATLYTGDVHGGGFHCNVVNVSNKDLVVTISILSSDGSTIAAGTATTISSGGVASTDSADPLPAPTDGFCQVQVLGTGDTEDLRVTMVVNLIRTFEFGAQTIPVYVTKTLVGN